MWEYLAFIVIAIMIVLRLYRRVRVHQRKHFSSRRTALCGCADKDKIVPKHDSRLESRRNAQSREDHRCVYESPASAMHNGERHAIANRTDAMPPSALRDAHLYHYYHSLGFAALSATNGNEHQ